MYFAKVSHVSSDDWKSKCGSHVIFVLYMKHSDGLEKYVNVFLKNSTICSILSLESLSTDFLNWYLF